FDAGAGCAAQAARRARHALELRARSGQGHHRTADRRPLSCRRFSVDRTSRLWSEWRATVAGVGMSEAWGRTGRRGWSARAARLVLAGQLGFSIAQIASMLLSRELWLADLANFIRPHLLVAGVALCVVGIALPHRSTKMGGIAALAAAAVPYLMLPAPAQPGDGQPITLVSANLLIHNTEVERFLAIPDVVSADILVLQEVRPEWQDALSATGLWPYESSRDLPANSDMKVFSRFPITGE